MGGSVGGYQRGDLVEVKYFERQDLSITEKWQNALVDQVSPAGNLLVYPVKGTFHDGSTLLWISPTDKGNSWR